jgi:hypothetical protein
MTVNSVRVLHVSMLVLVNLSVKKCFVFFGGSASTSVMCLSQENAFNTPSPAFSHVM